MVCKVKVFLGMVFVVVLSLQIASALEFANFTLVTNQFVNLGENNTVTISVMSNNETQNITEVKFMFWGSVTGGAIPEVFFSGSNWTVSGNSSDPDVGNLTFTNVSWDNGNVRNTNLTFTNLSASGIVRQFTTLNFSFNVTTRGSFTGSSLTTFFNVNVTATGVGGATAKNSSAFRFSPGFAFTGFILNETGCALCWQNYTNVTIYGVQWGTNGPPTSTALASTLSNTSGFFRLSGINFSSEGFNGYRLKMIYFNGTASSPGNATKIGTSIPDFPAFMFYGMKSNFGESEAFDMSLNKATFYLQPAGTLNFTATNITSLVSFGYEVIDQALGYPVESSVLSSVTSAAIVVPANRGYTVSFFRSPRWPGSTAGYLNDPATCYNSGVGVDFMNASTCPAPPRSYSISNLNASQVLTFNQSLVVRKVNVYGCINPDVGANNSAVNITMVSLKLVPWTTSAGSFIPPRSGDDGTLNISNPLQLNTTYPGCLGFYNFSLLNETNYMMEVYAKNATNESSHPGTANNLAGWLNFTADDDYNLSLTLYKLAGSYVDNAGTSVNTSMIKINTVNSTGGAVTTSINANVKIKNKVAGVGTLVYMVDSTTVSNGMF